MLLIHAWLCAVGGGWHVVAAWWDVAVVGGDLWRQQGGTGVGGKIVNVSVVWLVLEDVLL